MFFVQINHTGKGFLFLIFREIKLRKYSSLHKLFYGLSKNHKYNAWTPNAGLQYYDIHSKSLQSVIRPLKRIKSRDFEGLNRKKTVKDTRSRITKNKRDFGLAVKAAKRLKGKQRKFVLGSLQQMRQDDGIRNVMQEKQDNVLLWTIN